MYQPCSGNWKLGAPPVQPVTETADQRLLRRVGRLGGVASHRQQDMRYYVHRYFTSVALPQAHSDLPTPVRPTHANLSVREGSRAPTTLGSVSLHRGQRREKSHNDQQESVVHGRPCAPGSRMTLVGPGIRKVT